MRAHHLLACVALVGSTSSAVAQRSPDGDLLLRVGGDTRVGPGDSVGTAVVVRSNAVIDGAIGEDLLVIRGNARVAGRVHGDVVVMNGHADLAPGAQVDGDVLLYASTLARSPGAVVGGQIHEEQGLSFGARAIWLFWLSITLTLIVAGLIFAKLAARSLIASSVIIAAAPGPTFLIALLFWVVLPAIAVVSFVTVIGIPLGFGIFFFVMPALAVLGYLVSSTALGRFVMRRRRPLADPVGVVREPLYAEVATGVVILQIIGFIPGLGGLVIIFAALLGAGALLNYAWIQRSRGKDERVVIPSA